MTVTGNAYSAIETTLAIATARYCYTEIFPRSFLIVKTHKVGIKKLFLAVNQFEDLYLPCQPMLDLWEPKQRTHSTTEKTGLRSITVYRNGHPIAGAPLETDTDKKMYLKTLGALAIHEHGHGISFEEYANHYLLVFDLTSTHQASHDYLHRRFAVLQSLRFDTASAKITEILLLGETASTIYINKS